MKLLTVLFIPLLVACAANKPTITNPPRFEKVAGLVQWHKVSSLDDLQTICNPKKYRVGLIKGCYRMEDNNTICNIYTVDQEKYFYDLGHELKHCFDGRFHDENNDSTKPIDKQ